MCVWVYVCADLYVSLSVSDKSLSNPVVQDTQCRSLLQSTEDKFIYEWCADNSWTRKWNLTYSAAAESAVRVVNVWGFTGDWGVGSGNLSKKKKKLKLDADQEWVLRKAWEHTNMKAHSWWIIPQVCWERSYSEVIQLWHQGFLLCVFRFTITGHMQGWRNSEITQRYKMHAVMRDKQKWQQQRLCCKQLATDNSRAC